MSLPPQPPPLVAIVNPINQYLNSVEKKSVILRTIYKFRQYLNGLTAGERAECISTVASYIAGCISMIQCEPDIQRRLTQMDQISSLTALCKHLDVYSTCNDPAWWAKLTHEFGNCDPLATNLKVWLHSHNNN